MALRAMAFGAAVSCELLIRELQASYVEHASSLMSFFGSRLLGNYCFTCKAMYLQS